MSELLALCYHAVSPRLRADISVTPARLEAQLRVLLRRGYRRAASRCEDRLGRPCRSLAYPYGDVDDRVAEAAAAAGCLTACTLPERMHAASALRWPRVGVWHDDGDARFRMKASPGLRRLRETRAWSPLASGWRSLAGSP